MIEARCTATKVILPGATARRVAAVLRAQMQLLRGDLVRALYAAGQVASGQTVRSIQAGVEQRGETLVGWLSGNATLRFVEHGRGPGKAPPTAALERWVKAKGLTGKGADQAFIAYAYYLQRRIALRRTRAGVSVQAGLDRGLSVHAARRASRRSIADRTAKGPPLAAVIEWMRDAGIRPTQAQAQRMMARAVALGIAKRGTRAFRRKGRGPVAATVARAWPRTLDAVGQAVGRAA